VLVLRGRVGSVPAASVPAAVRVVPVPLVVPGMGLAAVAEAVTAILSQNRRLAAR
jgi:hypothetical protein